MSQKKKSGSCLGLFIKSFILGVFMSVIFVGGCALVAVKAFGSDPALWSDFSGWSSRGWLSVYFITLMSSGFALVISIMGAAITSLFGGGSSKGSSSKKRSRPKSARRTTV